MGFFKSLAYIAGGAALAPFTGGASLIPAIAAGVAVKKTAEYVSDRIDERDNRIRNESAKAAEGAAAKKYEKTVANLTDRLKSYHDLDKTILGFYAVGLAIANADGHICEAERAEIDGFVAGCSAGSLPAHVKATIAELSMTPPSLERAVQFAVDAKLSKDDINDVIDVVAMADGTVCEHEKAFIAKWKELASDLVIA
jgi:uncharacterized membrane protein YebE (DUF533 family)